MAYRGVYRDGVIVPEEVLRLADGTRVDFDIVAARANAKGRTATKKKARKSLSADQRVEKFMLAFGVRKGDPASKGKSSAAIARELRQRALGGRFGG